MSDAKSSDKSERPDHNPEHQILKSADAQAARTASGTDINAVEKTRTHASDGSLSRYSGVDLASQEQSIELVFKGKVTSRSEKLTEAELMREHAKNPDNVNTHGLESIAGNEQLPVEKRALAGMIQDMRAQSKSLGAPTTAIDDYAREALKQELKAVSGNRDVDHDDQEHCGEHEFEPRISILESPSIGGISRSPVPPDNGIAAATGERSVTGYGDSSSASTLLHGYASEPQNWQTLGQLPEGTQLEVLTTALKGQSLDWTQEEAERRLGALIGTTEGVGMVLQDLAKLTDFSHACLTGDKETAANMGADAGEAVGRMLVGGYNVFELSQNYLGDLGAQGDWLKPAKDLAHLAGALDHKWSQIEPREQERLKSQFLVELGAGAVAPAAATKLFNAAKFSEVLPNIVKIIGQSGAELGEAPSDLNRAVSSIRGLFEDIYAPEVVTPEGQTIRLTREARDLYMLSQVDDTFGASKPADLISGKLQQKPDAVNRVFESPEIIARFAQRFGIDIPPKDTFVFAGEKDALSLEAASSRLGISTDQLRSQSESTLSTYGIERVADYRDTYFNKYPGLIAVADRIVVQHGIPPFVLRDHPGLFTAKEINELGNLRGLAKTEASLANYRSILNIWNQFKLTHASPTRQQVIDQLKAIDREFGKHYLPPSGGR